MRSIPRFLLTALLLLAVLPAARAGVDDLLPRPKQVIVLGGTVSARPARIRYVKEIPGAALNQEEAYRLRVTRLGVRIEAVTEHGAWNALRTLDQLAEEDGSLPRCTIVDWPSFRIRGFMQDVGRRYISLEELKREINNLARFKINVLHWHLTENQAWRLEIKAFPQLTAPVIKRFNQLPKGADIMKGDRCSKCGCVLKYKTSMHGNYFRCPRKKWGYEFENPIPEPLADDFDEKADQK